MQKFILILLLILQPILGYADPKVSPLPAAEAFVFSPYVDGQDKVVLQWHIAPDYYLYQNKLTLVDVAHQPIKVNLPKATPQKDFMGVSHLVYAGLLKFELPQVNVSANSATFILTYQGCSKGGFCYAPIKKEIAITTTPSGKKITTTKFDASDVISPQEHATKLFAHHSLFFIIMSFLGLGLLLAFTPCVLPIIPILSSIIVGQKKRVSTWHAFSLSLSYVIGMSITYAIAGVVVALLGQSVQVFLEQPWVIILFSLLFMALALSLFGLFELHLPGRVQREITEISMKQKGGTYLGVFFMGVLSTLIVSPCVSPPLVGVLSFIAQTGDVLLGATALLALGFGMGIPLLIIGASAGKFLPKSGPWMDWMRKILGMMMLGVAFFMLSRVLSEKIAFLGWAILLILFAGYNIFYYHRQPARSFFQIVGGIIGIYGILLCFNIFSGNINLLQPWQSLGFNLREQSVLPFVTIAQNDDLAEQVHQAKLHHQFILMDFYAKWCSECIVIEQTIFTDKEVYNALKGFKLIRIDVTANSAFDSTLMQHYKIYAPPTMLFFNPNGKELSSYRIVGATTKEALLTNIQMIEERNRAKSI